MEYHVEINPESFLHILKKLAKETGYRFYGTVVNPEKGVVIITGSRDADSQAKIFALSIKETAKEINADLDTFIDDILAEVAKGRNDDAR